MTALLRSLAALVLMFAAALPSLARADHDNDNKRIISLAATGSIKTAPDKVDISTGVTSQAPSAKDALAKNSDAMSQVIDALKSEGLDPKDIQTTNLSVQPVYEERKEGRAPAIIAYQVTNSVRITVHDIGKLGAILDKVVTFGANDVGSIEFGVSGPEALRDEARKQAVSQATANAKLYAEAVGGTLGKVLTIAEDEGMVVTRYASPAPVEMAAKALPIEAGTA
ncbi:MAG TPA: SIMPL domain-containing protein, partial [Methyloceanibacter sp.]|nr:SIMPL domain-containing protein [Methyloceanibacter sp.]